MADTTNTTAQKEHPDLYKRSIKGSYWVILTRAVTAFLSFGKTLFIANFFLLNDLGIIGAAVMMMDILNTFTQTGFESALIQKKDDIHDYLDTAWTAGIIKGLMLFLVLYFAAPLMASFKIPDEKIPLAVSVFRAMSLCFLITGFRNIGAIYFSKNLEFHKTFSLSLISTLADIVLSIGLVLIFRSIWGLIIARLISAVINCIGTYILSSYRPKLHFERAKAGELWKFGRWIFGANILGYILEAGDDYFVWFYLGISPLALYRYAFKFAMMPTSYISHVISQVSFPAYSKIQKDLPRLRDAYLKVLRVTSLLSVPTAFLIFILGPDFVYLFLAERWQGMITTLQVLSIVGLITSLGTAGSPVMKAMEKLRPILYFQWIRIFLLALLIYPLTKLWGIMGTATAIASARLLIFIPGLIYAARLITCPLGKMCRVLLLPVIASIIMLISLLVIKHYWLTGVTHVTFGILLLLGLLIYSSSAWWIDNLLNWGLRDMLNELVQPIIVSQRFSRNTRLKSED